MKAQVQEACNCFSPVLVHLSEAGQALWTLNERNISYVKPSRRHCFIVNNSNTFFYTYRLLMWHKKRLSAVTQSSNTIHSSCLISIQSENLKTSISEKKKKQHMKMRLSDLNWIQNQIPVFQEW